MALGLAAALTGAAWSAEEPAPKGNLTIEQVPAPVKTTIEKEGAGAHVEAIVPLMEEGKTIYLTALSAEGKQITLRVAQDGQLLQKASHEDLKLEQVPAVVQATIKQEGGGAELKELARVTQDDKVLYLAVLAEKGKEISLTIEGDGKLLHKATMERLTLEQVPPAVRATIEKEAKEAKAEVQEIVPVGDPPDRLYLVELSAKGKEIALRVDSAGKVVAKDVDEELTLEQTPTAVKMAIEAEAKGGKVEEVRRVMREGKTTYEACLSVGGKAVELSLDPEGKVLAKEVEEEEQENKNPK